MMADRASPCRSTRCPNPITRRFCASASRTQVSARSAADFDEYRRYRFAGASMERSFQCRNGRRDRAMQIGEG